METNTRVYSTFKAFPGLFSGIIRYQSRIPTKTDASYDVVARYKTQTSRLCFVTSREIDDDRSWQYAASVEYQFDQFDKIHFLTRFGRRGHDNAATVFAFGFGGSYDMTERTSLAVIVGQHRQSGAANIDISLNFNWSFGDAPNGERSIADPTDQGLPHRLHSVTPKTWTNPLVLVQVELKWIDSLPFGRVDGAKAIETLGDTTRLRLAALSDDAQMRCKSVASRPIRAW